ncbi:putative sulfate exporter family transporter [Micromonospora deserti]|uniref:Uncharacterized protein n=1 Tax=Micromonospora deserti TaxID=2070366 RepID=A0A2W2DPW9_9ACTN|nr:putative sulfate exporter family transporter [Micromonospora deserti]PZG03000.1 hypothetical protein C1I99_00035 [Micromonospora deserti]
MAQLPGLILLFLLASLVATAGAIPAAWRPELAVAGVFVTTVALTGSGLSLGVAQLRRAGPRPLLLGAVLWVAVAASSPAVQALTGQL